MVTHRHAQVLRSWPANWISKCTPPHVKSSRLSGDKTLYEHAPPVREGSRALERGRGGGCARSGRRAPRRAPDPETLGPSDPTRRPSPGGLRGAAGVRPPVWSDPDLRGLLLPGAYLRGDGRNACPPRRGGGIVPTRPGPRSRGDGRGRKWCEVLVQLPHTRWRDCLRLRRTALWLHADRSGASGTLAQRCRTGPRSGSLPGGHVDLPLPWGAQVPPALIHPPRPRPRLEDHRQRVRKGTESAASLHGRSASMISRSSRSMYLLAPGTSAASAESPRKWRQRITSNPASSIWFR